MDFIRIAKAWYASLSESDKQFYKFSVPMWLVIEFVLLMKYM